MADDQRNARIFGVLFIITFLTSIPAVFLFQPVLDDPAGYIVGGGKENQSTNGRPRWHEIHQSASGENSGQTTTSCECGS